MLIKYAMAFITMEAGYIAIVGYIACKANKNIGTIEEIKHFRWIQILFILEAASQIFWMVDYAKIWKYPLMMDWMVNMTYVAAFGLSMYAWLCFIVEKVRFLQQTHLNKFVLRLQTATAIFHLLVILSSVWTKWIFYVGEDGSYFRGKLFWINVLCCYSHWVWATVLILVNGRNASKATKRQLQKFLTVSFLPVFGGIMQFFFYDVSFLEPACMLSIFFLFTVLQETQIKTDALTGLNNRAQLEIAYERMLNRATHEPFVIFVADIDHFKQINDTYGHLVGDQALLLVAKSLKSLGEKYPSLGIYRYGGDEFVLLIPRKDIRTFDLFSAEINDYLLETKKQSNLKFELKFSIGYQLVDDKCIDGKKAFDQADQMLYEQKHKLMVSL